MLYILLYTLAYVVEIQLNCLYIFYNHSNASHVNFSSYCAICQGLSCTHLKYSTIFITFLYLHVPTRASLSFKFRTVRTELSFYQGVTLITWFSLLKQKHCVPCLFFWCYEYNRYTAVQLLHITGFILFRWVGKFPR